MDPMFEALKRIRDARDYFTEYSKYPEGTVSEGQLFDDWAADVAESAIAPEMAELDAQADALNMKRLHRTNMFTERG